jgi:hypothetical protein
MTTDRKPLSYEQAVEAETLATTLMGFDRYLFDEVPTDEAIEICGALTVGTFARVPKARRAETLKTWMERVQIALADGADQCG